MLEINDPLEVDKLLDELEDTITLPKEWAEFFEESGVLPTSFEERRQFARRRRRTKAVLEVKNSLSRVATRDPLCCVYLNDVSRSGVSFINARQLFPGDLVTVWTSTESFDVSLVRCQRHNEHCYAIGGVYNERKPICLL